MPAAPRTAQTTPTATTVTMPSAIENRNDVFITDQGSTWVSRRWALRTRRVRPAVGRRLGGAVAVGRCAGALDCGVAASTAANRSAGR